MRAGPGGPNFKIVLLGEGRVGKTSLALRYVQGTFSSSQPPSTQAAYLSKRLLVGGRPVTLSIWDTAGQERFHALGPIYYRDADAALLVHDVTDSDTLERVRRWVVELRAMAPPGIVLAIAANKSDLVPDEEDGALMTSQRYAESIGASHHVTSAKLGTGIDEAFSFIVAGLLARGHLDGEDGDAAVGGIKIVEAPVAAPSAPQASCCS